jgi:hypothetical protein
MIDGALLKTVGVPAHANSHLGFGPSVDQMQQARLTLWKLRTRSCNTQRDAMLRILRSRVTVACESHNLIIGGSTPPSATRHPFAGPLPAIRQATIYRRAAMRNLIEQWRKLADENGANETMADAMDPEVFATCIQAHRIKRELYDQCADQLEAALSKSGAPAEQSGEAPRQQLKPKIRPPNCANFDSSLCKDVTWCAKCGNYKSA